MNREQLVILIIFCIFLSCKKEEINTSDSLRIKTIKYWDSKDLYTETYSFEYKDSIVEMSFEFSHSETHGIYVFYYNDDKKLIKMAKTTSELGGDPYLSHLKTISYLSNKIIDLTKRFNSSGILYDKDSIVFNLNSQGKIISKEYYSWFRFDSTYSQNLSDVTYLWTNNNVSSLISDTYESNYEYDISIKNPIFPISSGLPDFFEYYSIISMSENYCTKISIIDWIEPDEIINYFSNTEITNLESDQNGYPIKCDYSFDDMYENYTGHLVFNYESY